MKHAATSESFNNLTSNIGGKFVYYHDVIASAWVAMAYLKVNLQFIPTLTLEQHCNIVEYYLTISSKTPND